MTSLIIKEIQEIESKILNNEIDDIEANQYLEDLILKHKEKEIQRYCGHLQGKIDFFKGDYNSGITKLLETYKKHGPHVRLLSEIAINYAMLGNFYESCKWYDKIKIEFKKASSILVDESAIRTLLVLSKIAFESMLFEDCLNYLNMASLYNKESNYWTDQIFLNKLRVMTFLNFPAEKWIENYKKVTLMTHKHRRFLFEKNYALLIAESRMSKFNDIPLRISEYIEKGMLPEDLQLTAAELLEIAIIENISIFSKNNHLFPKLEKLALIFLTLHSKDIFEKVIQDTLIHQLRNTDSYVNENISIFDKEDPLKKEYEWCLHILKEIQNDSVLGQFRVLNLMHSEIKNISLKKEIKNRAFLIAQGFTSNNKLLIKNRWPKLFNQDLKSIIEFDDKTAVIHKKEIPLPKHPLAKVLFDYFNYNTKKFDSITLEELTDKIWNQPFNESHLVRIKVGLQRINVIFRPYIQGQDVFKYSKTHVKLNKNIDLIFKPLGSK